MKAKNLEALWMMWKQLPYQSRLLVYLMGVAICWLIADQLDSFNCSIRLVSTSFKTLAVFTSLFAVYLFWRAWPLARRFDDDIRFRIEAEKAPQSLGLSGYPSSFGEHGEEDES